MTCLGARPRPARAALSSDRVVTVSITVNPVNDAPVVSAITGSSPVDESTTARTYTFTISDVDSSSFTVVALYPKCGANGTVSGTPTITGNAGTFNCMFPDGPASSTVSVKVSDGTDVSNESAKSVAVSNVVPVVTAGATGSGVACISGNSVTLGFSWTDPAGTYDTYSYDVNWGDATAHSTGSNATSPVSGLTHTYGAGSYTITVIVSDETGPSSPVTLTVNFAYNVTGVLQPVNDTQAHNDPSIFKYGSTIPVKIRVRDCSGAARGRLVPQISLKKTEWFDPALWGRRGDHVDIRSRLRRPRMRYDARDSTSTTWRRNRSATKPPRTRSRSRVRSGT